MKSRKVKDVSGKTLKSIIKQIIEKGSSVVTDEWKSYNGLSENYNHLVVNHGSGEYVNGIAHTNTLEGFWSLFKRGIVGQYQNLSAKYLNKYISEFCFRYNSRNNKAIFDLTIRRVVTI